MYSYEDRIRAVKLYEKLGNRTGATILQWGYRQRMRSRAGIGSSNKVTSCQWAMCVRVRSIRPNKRRWPSSSTSTMIVALLEL